jgi:hypothetical protein
MDKEIKDKITKIEEYLNETINLAWHRGMPQIEQEARLAKVELYRLYTLLKEQKVGKDTSE